jgi:hypothetical protein
MEILGLDPYQSETQYPERYVRELRSGNKPETFFRQISTSFPLAAVRMNGAEIYWKCISALKASIFNKSVSYF